MTFEEIREMVNSTITENGQRQITGKALNLALNEMVTAMIENKPEGGGAETVYIADDFVTMELTPEHQAINAATYAKCAANVAEGKSLPMIVIDVTAMYALELGTTERIACVTQDVVMTLFVNQDSPLAAEMLGLMIAIDGLSISINEYGLVTVLT